MINVDRDGPRYHLLLVARFTRIDHGNEFYTEDIRETFPFPFSNPPICTTTGLINLKSIFLRIWNFIVKNWAWVLTELRTEL